MSPRANNGAHTKAALPPKGGAGSNCRTSLTNGGFKSLLDSLNYPRLPTRSGVCFIKLMPRPTSPHLRRRPLNPGRAFTLIELLTVIAVIGILAAILIPVVGKVRETARSAHCVRNLSGLGAAFQLYAADNRQMYPALRYRAADPAGNKNPSAQGWQVEINPYLTRAVATFSRLKQSPDADSYAFCPEFVRKFRDDPNWNTYTTGGYGMNPELGIAVNVWNYRFNSLRIVEPSRTILVGDSGDFHLSVNGAWQTNTTSLGGYASGDPVRHGNRATYLFADGHVEKLTPEAALVVLDRL
jgi:prepilin-type processing-associated H-X9-DG protein/prepilin-type N-terminal cleavage/methylation domain-containing protein